MIDSHAHTGESKSLECPNCHLTDRVQKVSALQKTGSIIDLKGEGGIVSGSYNFGTNDISTSVGMGSFSASGTQMTLLSQQLAFKETTLDRNDRGSMWAFFIFMGISLSALVGAMFVPAILFGGITVLAFFRYRHKETEYQVFYRQWLASRNLALKRWQSLYYCHRCDGVFVPGKSGLIPTDQMSQYLYANEVPTE